MQNAGTVLLHHKSPALKKKRKIMKSKKGAKSLRKDVMTGNHLLWQSTFGGSVCHIGSAGWATLSECLVASCNHFFVSVFIDQLTVSLVYTISYQEPIAWRFHK